MSRLIFFKKGSMVVGWLTHIVTTEEVQLHCTLKQSLIEVGWLLGIISFNVFSSFAVVIHIPPLLDVIITPHLGASRSSLGFHFLFFGPIFLFPSPLNILCPTLFCFQYCNNEKVNWSYFVMAIAIFDNQFLHIFPSYRDCGSLFCTFVKIWMLSIFEYWIRMLCCKR